MGICATFPFSPKGEKLLNIFLSNARSVAQEIAVLDGLVRRSGRRNISEYDLVQILMVYKGLMLNNAVIQCSLIFRLNNETQLRKCLPLCIKKENFCILSQNKIISVGLNIYFHGVVFSLKIYNVL